MSRKGVIKIYLDIYRNNFFSNKKQKKNIIKNTVKPCLLSHGVKTESQKICYLKNH